MTPRRLDPDSLHEKLAHLRQLLTRLERLGPLTRERLEREEVERAAGERWLTLVAAASAKAPDHYGEYVRQAAGFVQKVSQEEPGQQ